MVAGRGADENSATDKQANGRFHLPAQNKQFIDI
jgi:hypothetical protein